MYNRGALAEFNTWHDVAKTAVGIPTEGKIGLNRGKPAPDKQRTTAFSTAMMHPSNADDYVWLHNGQADPEKTDLSLADIKTAGW